MSRFYQGQFKPINPLKYTGDVSNIVYRSSWELKFMRWCDATPSVIKWSSEETIIPYICSTDNKPHRYFVDFKLTVVDKSGQTKTYLVEIKPLAQTKPPVPPKKRTKRYLTEVNTFIKNQSKWNYAKQYAADRGWEFWVVTEIELGIK